MNYPLPIINYFTRDNSMLKKIFWWGTAVAAVLFLSFAAYVYFNRDLDRILLIGTWFEEPSAYPEWWIWGGERCPNAPMLLPSTGYIGVGWSDGTPPFYAHTGYDIFSPDGGDNRTPIYAAYDGYLTREANWRSAVIIRHPDFAELPDITGGEQIWTYYTHMASRDGETSYIAADFPAGTREKFVPAGTLLGYQGTWSGDPNNTRMGLHLHFSVVQSNPDGSYKNETAIGNTYDPAPFLGIVEGEDRILRCGER